MPDPSPRYPFEIDDAIDPTTVGKVVSHTRRILLRLSGGLQSPILGRVRDHIALRRTGPGLAGDSGSGRRLDPLVLPC